MPLPGYLTIRRHEASIASNIMANICNTQHKKHLNVEQVDSNDMNVHFSENSDNESCIDIDKHDIISRNAVENEVFVGYGGSSNDANSNGFDEDDDDN